MKKNDRLKMVRLLKGFTQSEVAAYAGISSASLGAIERGRYYLSAESNKVVAELLRVSPDYLSFGDPSIDFLPQVWIPQPPTRAQHLDAMKKDIESLFPEFLSENKFDVIQAANLEDGFLLLLGRTIVGKETTKKHSYNCLLLAQHKLAHSFRTAVLKTGSFKGLRGLFNTIASLNDATIESLSINLIYEKLQLNDHLYESDLDGLCKEMAVTRKRAGEREKAGKTQLPPAADFIFENYVHAFYPAIKWEHAAEIRKSFIQKCEEFGHLPRAKVADILITQITEEFKKIGISPLIEKPTKDWFVPENEEYRMLQCWLKEKLADKSTSQDQRIAFLEKITKDTDFHAWKEKYEREGKHFPQVWF